MVNFRKSNLILVLVLCISLVALGCSSSDNNVEDNKEPEVAADVDKDGIADTDDNCVNTANTNQKDFDGDGLGDVCDKVINYTTEPCTNGMAGKYPCNDYDLLLHIPLDFLDALGANDSWGWTDPDTNKEYAIIGLDNGTAFIDITNPNEAIYLGKLPTATSNSSWRDIKVYNNHAFIVSEALDHGMQVFDLTRLRNVGNPPTNFSSDVHYTKFGNAHNIVINESNGFAYVVGSDTFAGGIHFIDITDPKNPTSNGGFSATGYTHDAQVVIYNGPDTDYTGKEIFVGSNEDEVVIVDITDRLNPKVISKVVYTNIGYTHQGWFTEDQKYFIIGDELDEVNKGFNTRTIVLDFKNLDKPSVKTTYTGITSAIDHNVYTKGNLLYLANYSAGVRFIDISGIENNTMTEVGFFDTYPDHDNAAFNGVWNVFPYFDSGHILISDIDNGLFVVKKK